MIEGNVFIIYSFIILFTSSLISIFISNFPEVFLGICISIVVYAFIYEISSINNT